MYSITAVSDGKNPPWQIYVVAEQVTMAIAFPAHYESESLDKPLPPKDARAVCWV